MNKERLTAMEAQHVHTGSADIHCPACGGSQLVDVFETKRQPGNVCVLLDTPQAAQSAANGDIILAYCQHCGFIFNRIFDYSIVKYVPGYEASLIHSAVFRKYITGVAQRLIDRYNLRNKTIVEIGCGQGEFLNLICELGNNRGIGIDPSVPDELLNNPQSPNIRYIRDFYTEKYADIDADFICCLSVFEHIPNPAGFLRMLRRNIGDRPTKIYFEIYNAWMAFKDQQTWSIHYEQCNYFSPSSYPALFERSGFDIIDCATDYENDQYLYVEAQPALRDEALPAVPKAMPIPREVADFARVHRERMAFWQQQFATFRAKNMRVVLWGSAGKGMSFLNALQAGDIIRYVVDINPNRQGKYIPCSAQLIVAPEFLQEYRPDVVIISNPLYKKEIRKQVEELGLTCQFLVA